MSTSIHELPEQPAQPAAKELPTIKVEWDAEKQAPRIIINPSEFKTWEMVIGVLTMAVGQAKFNLEMGRMQAIQQQAAAQMQSQAIQGQILGKKLIRH